MMTSCQMLPLVLCALVSLAGEWKSLGIIKDISELRIDPAPFISKHVTNIPGKAFQVMSSARKCLLIPGIIKKFFVKRIKLNYFYGPSTSDRIIVPLSNASLLLNNIRWKKGSPMAIYVSGWINTPTNEYSKQVIDAYYTNGRFNLILVDWSKSGSFMEYGTAVTMVPQVGRAVARAIEKMLKYGATLGHVCGHSLGAHIAGYIGRNLPKPPPMVIGLDPAGPLFYPTMFQCQDPIASTDGEYVVVLHTDWNRLGSNKFTGSSDFMPCGGSSKQPGCNFFDFDKYGPACSHYRAVSLWCAAVRDTRSILGIQCSSYEKFKKNKCENNSISALFEPNRNLKGVFYFTTNNKVPFGKGVDGL